MMVLIAHSLPSGSFTGLLRRYINAVLLLLLLLLLSGSLWSANISSGQIVRHHK